MNMAKKFFGWLIEILILKDRKQLALELVTREVNLMDLFFTKDQTIQYSTQT
jgi:hypothetical protein